MTDSINDDRPRLLASFLHNFFQDESSEEAPVSCDRLATETAMAAVKTQTGYKLPSAYRHLLQIRNGGKPKLTHISCKVDSIGSFLDIDCFFGVGDPTRSIEVLGQRIIEEGGLPKNLGLLFGADDSGHGYWFLDYRNVDPESNDPCPKVVYMNEEYLDPDQIIPVADSFTAFVRALIEEPHDDADY